MRRWARFSVLLLAAAYAAAGLPGLIAHGLHHHAHEADGRHGPDGSGSSAATVALKTLLHGHAHPDGIPEHSHRVSLTVPMRSASPDLPRCADCEPFRSAGLDRPVPASCEPAEPLLPPGAGPPSLLHWLCILLI